MSGLPAPTWWAQARTVFVGFHLLAITLVAIPSVGSSGLDRAAWKEPTVQGEFRAWSERLTALGLRVTPEEFEEGGWAFATTFERVRSVVLTPFGPYYRYCATYQSWKMFVAPHRFPTRVEIAVDRGRGFEVLYLARDPDHDWHGAWFDHDRFRSSLFRMGWPQYKSARRNFLDFVEARVREELPEARRVRVSFLRTRTPTPAETVAGAHPEPERTLSNTRVLSELRP